MSSHYQEYLNNESNSEPSINKYEHLFKRFINKPPSLEEALIDMFCSSGLSSNKSKSLFNTIISKINNHLNQKFPEIQKKYKDITYEDAQIISSYTCELNQNERDYNPYKLLNSNLVANDRMSGVRNISKYLFIFLKALRKLDRYYPDANRKFLYRCITKQVQLNYDSFDKKKIPYLCGENKMFWAFTSASTNPQTSFKFLGGKNHSNRFGTIFSLTGDIWGYDISLFNVFNEEEILIEPEREIIVDESIPPINEIIYVRCQIKKTPLVLENIYKQINNNMLNFSNANNINIINNDLLNNNIDNYIIAKINIKDEDINKNIKILSSYEEFIRANPGKLNENDIYKNEDEIKQCKININDEIIQFSYYYKFKSKGEYTIKYSFKNNLKSLCLIFGGCELITKIDLSHFNTKDIIYMNTMFYGCSSLKIINLSNFNTNNVTNMSAMFYECSSLKNIDLSNFNTNNVTDMGCMFYGCPSLNKNNIIIKDKIILNNNDIFKKRKKKIK